MQTNTGTMSIEVDDFDKFELFVLNCFENEEDTDTFRRLFYEPILGEPTDAELKNREIIDKAINFYCNDKGLKVAYPASDGNSTDWYYADSKENSLVFNNCIN